jgi:hypothetical protein
MDRIADESLRSKEERDIPTALPALRLLWSAATLMAVLMIGLYMGMERAAEDELAWSNGIEAEMSRLDSEFEFFGEASASVPKGIDEFSSLDEEMDELRGRISL